MPIAKSAEHEQAEMQNPEGILKRGIFERINSTRPLVKWMLGSVVAALTIGGFLMAKEVTKPEDIGVFEPKIIVPQPKINDQDEPAYNERSQFPKIQKGPKNSNDNKKDEYKHKNNGGKQKEYKVPGSDKSFTLMA